MRSPALLLTGVLALCAAPARARGDTVVVVGDGEGVAAVTAALRRPGREVLGAEEAALRLARMVPHVNLEEARARAAEGQAAYTATTFDTAIERFRRASAIHLQAGAPAENRAELARTFLDLGIAELAAGQEAAARRDVTLALRLQAALEVDRTVHGPPVRRFVDAVRAAEPRAGAVASAIVTDPVGATIAVDGVDRGPSPLSVSLSEGPHVIAARLDGRPDLAQVADVSARAPARIEMQLFSPEPARGALAALAAGRLDQAAWLSRLALHADLGIAVHGLRAARNDVHAARMVTAGSADELARAVTAAPPVVRVASGAAPRATEPGHRARARHRASGGGLPAWVWIGGAAVLTAAAASAALIATSSSDRVLVPRLE